MRDITWALVGLVYFGVLGFLVWYWVASLAAARYRRRRERAEATRAADNELGRIALRRKYLKIAEEYQCERDRRVESERMAA